jgi:hypothetical protein
MDTIIEGRSISDGYKRGWGLRYGELKNMIEADDDFISCYQLISTRSLLTVERIMNIFFIMKHYLPKIVQDSPFSIMEFGSYRGGSAIFMASLAKRIGMKANVFALDTFEGMPETDPLLDAHHKEDFNDIDLNEIIAYSESLGLDNLHFIQGLFENTTLDILIKSDKVAMAHIDCDIYSAVVYAYDVVKPYMFRGGYIIFDDATEPSCLGATYAVEKNVIQRDKLHCEQIYPHYVFRSIWDN